MTAMKFLSALGSSLMMVSSAFALQAGDEVKPDALAKATFLQGDAVTAWEPGKLYFLECWATWCGPCIASIPHVNELHKKYHDKGLRVIGLNVWDDGQEKVAKFVKAKGEGMSYPVAFVGRGGLFETDWLKPAGVTGIPHTFLVRDGKLLATQHPGQLTDEIIEGLLAGGGKTDDSLAAIRKQKEDRATETQLLKEFREARQARNATLMGEKLNALTGYPGSARRQAFLKLDIAEVKADWPAALAAVREMPDDATALMPLGAFARTLADERKVKDAPEDLRRGVVEKLLKAGAGSDKALESQGAYIDHLPLAALQWSVGEKEAATALVRKLAANAQASPKQSLQRYADSLAKGALPTMAEFSEWMAEERKAAPSLPAPAGK